MNSYLPPEKGVDGPDSAVLPSDRKSLTYKPVFQFPQEPQQFPTHPARPFKPTSIELPQPPMKFSPGSGTGRFVLSDTSPFPAPYLQDRGPGMQTPYTEMPIQRQPRASNGKGQGSVQLATAISQRKQRTLHSHGKRVSHGNQTRSKPRSSTVSASFPTTSEPTGRQVTPNLSPLGVSFPIFRDPRAQKDVP